MSDEAEMKGASRYCCYCSSVGWADHLGTLFVFAPDQIFKSYQQPFLALDLISDSLGNSSPTQKQFPHRPTYPPLSTQYWL